jgi:hypothetical protein
MYRLQDQIFIIRLLVQWMRIVLVSRTAVQVTSRKTGVWYGYLIADCRVRELELLATLCAVVSLACRQRIVGKSKVCSERYYQKFVICKGSYVTASSVHNFVKLFV